MSVRKLTAEDVKQIRELDKARVQAYLTYRSLTRYEIAKKFDVSYTTVTNICDQTSYQDVM